MPFPLIVFLGAGIGGTLRYGVNLLAIRLLGEAFPFGTFAINVAGSFVMGCVAAAFIARIGIFGDPDPLRRDRRHPQVGAQPLDECIAMSLDVIDDEIQTHARYTRQCSARSPTPNCTGAPAGGYRIRR